MSGTIEMAKARKAKAGTAEWVDSQTAARMIGRSTYVVARLAREGRVRSHAPEGVRPLYFVPDLMTYIPPSAA